MNVRRRSGLMDGAIEVTPTKNAVIQRKDAPSTPKPIPGSSVAPGPRKTKDVKNSCLC